MVIGKDYQGLLDISKLAWINGKKGQYIRSDGSQAFLKLNQDDAIKHSESSFAIFVRDSSEDTEAINAIRQQATNLVQNVGDASVLGHIWSNKSIPKLTAILQKLEDNSKQLEQVNAKQQQDANQALQDSKNQSDEANREIQRYISDNNLEGVKYSADARSESHSSRDEARPANDVERALADHKINTDNAKLGLEEKHLSIEQKKANQVKSK